MIPPVHLEPDVLDHLSGLARAQDVSMSELVDALLKEDNGRIEAAK
ncbi:hypothetical protein BRAO375_2320024 [Bradyrhizobium sp. ORS 375]|nr:hypothetical protein [Bradyrhizobium sp. ORS 375]CCD92918.1 hypothetical protein BRAO375_2320024 [Bradyrhizobium sp. ORS 375]